MAKSRIDRKAKSRKRAIGTMIGLLVFSLATSAYYLIDSLIEENSYKIYVGGTNSAQGLLLSYDKDFEKGYSDLTGKGLRLEDCSRRGLSIGSSSLEGNGNRNYDVLSYLMSVGSNQENTVETNVTDKGHTGEANGDQFLTSKFYLKNTKEANELNAEDGIVDYGVKVSISRNESNALSAIRLALIEVTDESKIYNYETGLFSNEYFNMNVFAQPKLIEQENGDNQIYHGDEENSQEYVATTVSGQYTTDKEAVLMKNPNKGKEKEDWKCTNLHLAEDRTWYYDSQEHAEDENQKLFSLGPQETKAYIVAAWYEASDPNHHEAIMAGYVTFTFTFYAVE